MLIFLPVRKILNLEAGIMSSGVRSLLRVKSFLGVEESFMWWEVFFGDVKY